MIWNVRYKIIRKNCRTQPLLKGLEMIKSKGYPIRVLRCQECRSWWPIQSLHLPSLIVLVSPRIPECLFIIFWARRVWRTARFFLLLPRIYRIVDPRGDGWLIMYQFYVIFMRVNLCTVHTTENYLLNPYHSLSIRYGIPINNRSYKTGSRMRVHLICKFFLKTPLFFDKHLSQMPGIWLFLSGLTKGSPDPYNRNEIYNN